MPSPAIPSPSSGSSFPSAAQQPPPPPPPPHQQQTPFAQTIVRDLENRLHFVEDAYMALRQYAQKLEQVQATQDHTLQWMRDRLDQISEANIARRDSVASPLTPQSGVISTTKRKADMVSDDSRSSRSRFETSATRHDSEGSLSMVVRDHAYQHHQHGHAARSGPGPAPGFEGPSNSGYHHSGSSEQHSQQQHYHDVPAHPSSSHHSSPAHMHQQAHHPHQQHPQGLQGHQYRHPTTQGKVY
ncbi:hypothetical protein BGZ65_010828 [Modicella reniformis]|uniref:Uncharacterized protein n=1 Tax=Modicella reniformis TaxID=1440133 RepID=A0A9P6MAI9_9FUNG|nr:hypothetical protein BGZ65_010828 [Modicella reniformis]